MQKHRNALNRTWSGRHRPVWSRPARESRCSLTTSRHLLTGMMPHLDNRGCRCYEGNRWYGLMVGLQPARLKTPQNGPDFSFPVATAMTR
jgi:hypothetical protein